MSSANRILSWVGCFGLTLLAILFALGVTEAIKYVTAIERTLVLTAAVLAAAAVAYLRDRIKNRRRPASDTTISIAIDMSAELSVK